MLSSLALQLRDLLQAVLLHLLLVILTLCPLLHREILMPCLHHLLAILTPCLLKVVIQQQQVGLLQPAVCLPNWNRY
jgi:hypothetical protein